MCTCPEGYKMNILRRPWDPFAWGLYGDYVEKYPSGVHNSEFRVGACGIDSGLRFRDRAFSSGIN